MAYRLVSSVALWSPVSHKYTRKQKALSLCHRSHTCTEGGRGKTEDERGIEGGGEGGVVDVMYGRSRRRPGAGGSIKYMRVPSQHLSENRDVDMNNKPDRPVCLSLSRARLFSPFTVLQNLRTNNRVASGRSYTG